MPGVPQESVEGAEPVTRPLQAGEWVRLTDRKGRHVTTLGPADFQVFQDGRLQPVTAVAYIRADERYLDEHGVPEPIAVPTNPRDAPFCSKT